MFSYWLGNYHWKWTHKLKTVSNVYNCLQLMFMVWTELHYPKLIDNQIMKTSRRQFANRDETGEHTGAMSLIAAVVVRSPFSPRVTGAVCPVVPTHLLSHRKALRNSLHHPQYSQWETEILSVRRVCSLLMHWSNRWWCLLHKTWVLLSTHCWAWVAKAL